MIKKRYKSRKQILTDPSWMILWIKFNQISIIIVTNEMGSPLWVEQIPSNIYHKESRINSE